MAPPHKAVIVEDEPLVMADLRDMLGALWPDLEIVGVAENGLEALRLIDSGQPDVLFLDIQLPGASGIEVARYASGRCHVIFVTAYDSFALAAFEHGAVDYVMKPVSPARLATAIKRAKARLAGPPADLERMLQRLSHAPTRRHVRWLSAPDGKDLRLITIDEICYIRAEDKYTVVVTPNGESLIRRPIRELIEELDPETFWQIHRGTVVNVNAIAGLGRDLTGRLRVRLKQRKETLPVSNPYVHRFR